MKTPVPRYSMRLHRRSICRPNSECGSNVVFGYCSWQPARRNAMAIVQLMAAARRTRWFTLIPKSLDGRKGRTRGARLARGKLGATEKLVKDRRPLFGRSRLFLQSVLFFDLVHRDVDRLAQQRDLLAQCPHLHLIAAAAAGRDEDEPGDLIGEKAELSLEEADERCRRSAHLHAEALRRLRVLLRDRHLLDDAVQALHLSGGLIQRRHLDLARAIQSNDSTHA